MSQKIAGTFASATGVLLGLTSAQLVIPSTPPQAKLNTTGLDASNTIKTQKSTDNGASWVDQVTYNSDQVNTLITVAHGEQWRVFLLAQQAGKQIQYSLGVES
ncbi:MAG: hypothetical protein RL684_1985 [Pseudomonadota bacterium]|jgi:hypothetical protein